MTRRPGTVSLLTLTAVPVLVLLAGLVLSLAAGRLVRTDLQNAADAAALAAARELVADPAAAQAAADRVAAANGVAVDVELAPRPGDPDATLVVATAVVRRPGGGLLDRDLVAVATAAFDRRVVGFRPLTDAPVPLIPLALFAPNGEPPATVRVAPRSADPPGVFVRIGVGSFRETVRQCCDGITRDELAADFPGGHVLGPDNWLILTGSPGCPPPASPAFALMLAAFEAVRDAGAPRLWPLCDRLGDGMVRVTGWTAARVTKVAVIDGGLTLTFAPVALAHPAAVVERRAVPPAFWAANRTVGRVRLVE